jgi:hypothetical protein
VGVRLTQAGIQWFVLMVVGTVVFIREAFTTKDPVVMTTAVGLMSTPAVFGKKPS